MAAGFSEKLKHAFSSKRVNADQSPSRDQLATEKDPSSIPTRTPPPRQFGHQSSLPLPLYLLSFSPPFPTPTQSLSHPSLFFHHPYTLYALGTLAAISAGVKRPLNGLVYGNVWLNEITREGVGEEGIREVGRRVGVWYVGIVVATFVLRFIVYTLFTLAGDILTSSLKHAYVQSIFSHDAIYFDKHGSGEIAAKANNDVAIVTKGLGEKVGFLIWQVSTAITSIIISFILAPKLAATLTATVLGALLFLILTSNRLNTITKPILTTESRTSTFIEQCFSGIRIVTTFRMQGALVKHLDERFLRGAERYGMRRAGWQAVEHGGMFFLLFAIPALGLFYGKVLLEEGVNAGAILTSIFNFFNLLDAIDSGLIAIIAVRNGLHRLQSLREAIERQPYVDIRDPSGLLPEQIPDWAPDVELRNVTFAYPSRASTKVLDDVSFKVEAGSRLAIVGQSGSGKSTIAHLICREYDPYSANIPHPADEQVTSSAEEAKPLSQVDTEKMMLAGNMQGDQLTSIGETVKGGGHILISGRDLRDCNLRRLRARIAVVHQEPQLLNASVLDNVAVGLSGTEWQCWPEDISADTERLRIVREKCEKALRMAECDFVEGLSEGIFTKITGGRQSNLSGGQQQRVALARALVREPDVLCLDEATSAVSSDMEAKIYANMATEQERRQFTIIAICHRLAFAETADSVVVMADGKVIDQGGYKALSSETGGSETFRALIAAAQLSKSTRSSESVSSADAKSSSSSSASTRSRTEITSATDAKEQGKDDVAPVRRFWQLLSKRQGLVTCTLLPFGIVTEFMIAALDSVYALMLGWGIAALVYGGYNGTSVNTYALWSLIVGIIAFVIQTLSSGALEINRERAKRILNGSLMKTLLQQNITWFESEQGDPGALTASISEHVEKVSSGMGIILGQITYILASAVSSTVLAFIMSWRIGVVGLPFVVVILAVSVLQIKVQQRVEARDSDEKSIVAPTVNEYSDACRIISAFALDEQAGNHIKTKINASLASTKGVVVTHLVGSLPETISFVALGVLLWWGAMLFAENKASIRELITAIEALVCMTSQTAVFANTATELAQAFSSWKVVSRFLNLSPTYATVTEGEEKGEGGSQIDFRGDIHLNAVTMSYPQKPGHNALRDCHLHIPAGRVTAFTGLSGGGKSTIFGVLQRFYEISSGSITFGGIDYRFIPIERLRSRMAVVSQSAVLFEGDIRFNLSLGSAEPESLTQADIDHACKQACILDFIKSLPDGYKTDIGMKGLRLSGGQRQRLCIARALLAKADILLLDEATSALDAASESLVEEALRNASVGRTTLVIAHKLQSLLSADKIVVLEEGRVIEEGTHENLLASGGRYKTLVETQLC